MNNRHLCLGLGAWPLFLLGCDRTPAASPSPDATAQAVTVPAASSTSSAARTEPAARPTPKAGMAASADGSVTFTATPITAIHTHGGDEAKIGRVSVTVRNASARARKITLTKVEYRTGHGCDNPKMTVSARPKPQLLVRQDDEDPRPPSTTVTLDAKTELGLSAQFDSVGAYYTYCDQFALTAYFSIDDTETVPVPVVMRVEREEPER